MGGRIFSKLIVPKRRVHADLKYFKVVQRGGRESGHVEIINNNCAITVDPAVELWLNHGIASAVFGRTTVGLCFVYV